MATVYGTENQDKYINILRSHLGDDAVMAATRQVLKLELQAPLPDSVSVESTSAIIDHLKLKVGMSNRSSGQEPSAAGMATIKRLSGRELLALADLDTPVPSELDADMCKVVNRLRRLASLRSIVQQQDKPLAQNGKEPIQVALLVKLLGGAAEAAKALGVTIKTLEGWGDYLPDSHESRAELITRGAVKARLPV